MSWPIYDLVEQNNELLRTKLNELLRRMTPTEVRRLISPAATGVGYTSKSTSGVSADGSNNYKLSYNAVTGTLRTNGSSGTLAQNTWNGNFKYTGVKYALVPMVWTGFTAYGSGTTWEGYVTYTDPITLQTVTSPTSTGPGPSEVVWDNPIYIPQNATNIVFYIRCTTGAVNMPYGSGDYFGSPLFSVNNDGTSSTYTPAIYIKFKQLGGTILYYFNLSKFSEDIFDFNWFALLKADWSVGTSTDAKPVNLEIAVDTSDTITASWAIKGTGLPAKNTVERITNRTQTFSGTGVLTEFTLTNTFLGLEIYRVVTVYINGEEIISGYYFDQSSSKVIFDEAPINGSDILVLFDLGFGRFPSVYVKVYLNSKSLLETSPTFNLLEMGYEVE